MLSRNAKANARSRSKGRGPRAEGQGACMRVYVWVHLCEVAGLHVCMSVHPCVQAYLCLSACMHVYVLEYVNTMCECMRMDAAWFARCCYFAKTANSDRPLRKIDWIDTCLMEWAGGADSG